MISKIIKQLAVYLSLTWTLLSCKTYSFTGTSLPKEVKTFSIQDFSMVTAGGSADMSLILNNKLREYFQRNTDLKQVPQEGDINISGDIIGYDLTPVSVGVGDKGSSNRLTIKLEVRFSNARNQEEDFMKEFAFYQDFSQNQTLTEVEPSLVPKILDQLVLNIFNDTAASW